ncbi:MAG TPA: hypothetical protein VG323_05655 [Thermoanaerobaculia bacterium]|nr:hypothetical protein [Thermoanaerobaculia bacterium]
MTMIPALAAVATLVLGAEHRVADFRSAAANGDEHVLAIAADRAITIRFSDGSLRTVPLDDPTKAATIAAGVSSAVAAPPLVAWTSGPATHIAPIDAPARGTVFAHNDVLTMKCNSKACLASTLTEILFLRLDGTIYMRTAGGARVLTPDDDGFLVQSSPTSLIRVDNNGLFTFITTTPPLPFSTAADFDGAAYSLVWPQSDPVAQTSTLQAATVAFNGVFGTPATIATLPAVVYPVDVAYSAGRHLVVFGYDDEAFANIVPDTVAPESLRGLRLNSALQPLDPQPFLINGAPVANLDEHVIARGNGFLVAWSHESVNPFAASDPEAAAVDADGHVGPRMLLSRGLAAQVASSVVTIPGAMLVGYLEFPPEAGTGILRIARFAPNGTAMGEVVVSENAWRSAMAARGSDVLIASADRGDKVSASILHADGSLQKIALPDLFGNVAAAASGSGWMLAIGGNRTLNVVRIDAGGTPSAPQTIADFPAEVATASDGDRFLVAWTTTAPATHAVLLDATGGVLANVDIAPARSLGGVAFAGGEYFVASTTGVRLNRDAARLGDATVQASSVAPFGNAVLAAAASKVVVVDHGVVVAEGPLEAFAPLVTSGGVAYTVTAGDVTAAMFRQIMTVRRRAAYH